MRAVIYTRVSSDPKQECRSVESQERECREFAARQGWTIVDVYRDNDRSASAYATREREDYARLKRDLPRRIADVLVMWEGSRATRDLEDFVQLRRICADNSVRYSYSGRVYDLTDTDDIFTVTLETALAEREAGVTRKRVLRGVRTSAQKGRPHGRVLFGYGREYDDRGTFIRQYIKEDEAAVVREAAGRVAAGEPCRAVARSFNRRGIRTPDGRDWNITHVRRMILRPSYIAQRVHQGKVVGPADWPAILDERVYSECVRRLSDPARKTLRDSSLKYLLTGAAQCGECDGKMRALKKNNGNPVYDCSVGHCVTVKIRDLEAYVRYIVTERLGRPDAAGMFDDPAGRDDSEAAAAEASELRSRLEEFRTGAADGRISLDGLASIEARLLPQIEAAEDRAKTLRIPEAVRQYARPTIGEDWPDIPIAARREIVQSLMTVRVMRTRPGARTFDPERVEIVWKC